MKLLFQPGRRDGDVGLCNDRRGDGDGAEAGLDDLGDIFFGDAGDGDGGDGDLRGDLAGVGEAGENVARFGGAGEDRADADVVGTVEDGSLRLVDVVRAHAQDSVRPDNLAGFDGGKVFLADVDAVGIGEDRDIGAVVDDAENVVLAAEGNELAGALEEFAAVKGFLAELQAVGAVGRN